MNENNLIPIPTEKKEKRNKKRKSNFFGKLIIYFLILCVGYYVYINFDNVKDYFKVENMQESQNDENNITDKDTDKIQNGNDIEENENSEIELIPENANIINSVEASFIEIDNKSGINADLDLSQETVPNFYDNIDKFGKDSPFILIIHSACNETYSNGKYYSVYDDFYNTKNNVKEVGDIICKTLNNNYVNTIHIDEIFGSGSIYNSRKDLENAIDSTLKTYPSIRVVLDISRGIEVNDDLSMDKMTTDINGKTVAQISLTVGADIENGNIYGKNLNFANVLLLESNNLIYDISIVPFKLSQDIEPIFLKVDIGTYANTIDEALASGQEFASLLYNVLN